MWNRVISLCTNASAKFVRSRRSNTGCALVVRATSALARIPIMKASFIEGPKTPAVAIGSRGAFEKPHREREVRGVSVAIISSWTAPNEPPSSALERGVLDDGSVALVQRGAREPDGQPHVGAACGARRWQGT